jgi:hypothetical protein
LTQNLLPTIVATNMRSLLLLATIFLMTTDLSAQAKFAGRWSTDPAPTGGWSGWNAEGGLNVFQSGPPLAQPEPLRKGGAFPKGLLLDLKIEGNSVTGFLGQDGLWGTPLRIELGTVEGSTIRFLTTRKLEGREPIFYHWVAELTDDNTMTLRGGNIAGGRGGEGRLLQAGRPPAPAPTSLPPVSRSGFLPAQTLRRVN